MERVVERLGRFLEQRRQAQDMEQALQCLTPAEKLVLDRLVIHPRKGAAGELCQLLEVEPSTVYRYRRRALKKLAEELGIN